MNAYYFRRDKTAVLGAIKAQLPFSKGKYQLLNSWNIPLFQEQNFRYSHSFIPLQPPKILFPTIFYYLNFHLPHPNRSNDDSSHKYPFKRPEKRYEKAQNCILSLFAIFSRWVPLCFALFVTPCSRGRLYRRYNVSKEAA